jgi:aminoglycoside phosphotransferase (APT) family kinase protein
VTAEPVPVGQLLDDLAEPLHRIHRIPGTHFGRLAGARRHTRWTDYLHDRLAAYTTAAPHLAGEAGTLHTSVDEMALHIEPRLVHHDLQPGHLVRDLTASVLLDWELAAFADPLSDLARLAVRLGTSSPDPVQCLVLHPDRHARCRLELYWRIHRLADAAFNTDSR